jgi:hypothetical protein
MDLQFRIQYKKGSTNQAADSLSRCSVHESVCSVAISNPEWWHKVKEGYNDDPVAVQLLKDVTENPSAVSNFSLKDGILRYKGRVWLGNNSLAQ